MPKLTKTYENGSIKSELTFNGEKYTITMLPYENGVSRSEGEDFATQIWKRTKNAELADEIEEITDRLSYDEDDEIQDALDELEVYEG